MYVSFFICSIIYWSCDISISTHMQHGGSAEWPPRNCMAMEYNCFSKVKKQYMENLKNGFLKNGQYFDPILIGFFALSKCE